MIGVFSPEREYKMKGFGGTLSALDKTEGHFCSIFILSLFLMIFMNVEKYGIMVWNTKPPSNPPVWSFSRKQMLPPQQCDMGSSRVVVDKYFGFRASFAAALKQ